MGGGADKTNGPFLFPPHGQEHWGMGWENGSLDKLFAIPDYESAAPILNTRHGSMHVCDPSAQKAMTGGSLGPSGQLV